MFAKRSIEPVFCFFSLLDLSMVRLPRGVAYSEHLDRAHPERWMWCEGPRMKTRLLSNFDGFFRRVSGSCASVYPWARDNFFRNLVNNKKKRTRLHLLGLDALVGISCCWPTVRVACVTSKPSVVVNRNKKSALRVVVDETKKKAHVPQDPAGGVFLTVQ